MKKLILTLTVIGALFYLQLKQHNLAAADSQPTADDTDLSGPRVLPADFRIQNTTIHPDAIEITGDTPGLNLQVIYLRNGQWMPISNLELHLDNQTYRTDIDGHIQLGGCSTAQLSVTASMEEQHYVISDGGQVYSLQFAVECNHSYSIKFQEASPNGQVISIFETLELARKKLSETVGLDFWQQKIEVQFPGGGDFYSFGTVNITNGHYWDVVGHELGHAIYDQAGLGAWGGGQHKIDECYSEGLALSEGWATFFSGWLHLDLNGTDPHFQYMVPRRAPIQIENVPADVCQGYESEWRVSSFFWDLVDQHVDVESVDEAFARVWQTMEHKAPKSVLKAAELMVQGNIPTDEVNSA